jgi:hypothetical protein
MGEIAGRNSSLVNTPSCVALRDMILPRKRCRDQYLYLTRRFCWYLYEVLLCYYDHRNLYATSLLSLA